MRITERSLRGLVRISLLSEASLATVSDITRFKPQLEEWIEILVDEMADAFPRMKEITEKQRENLVSGVLRKLSLELISLTSGMSYDTKKEIGRREKQASHDEWDQKRKRRSANVQYYGDYQGSW